MIRGDVMTKYLSNGLIPGKEISSRYYWLYPILVNNRDQLINKLRKTGILATKSATTFGCLYKLDKDNLIPKNCLEFAQKVVYLPYSPEMPKSKMLEMIDIINNHT